MCPYKPSELARVLKQCICQCQNKNASNSIYSYLSEDSSSGSFEKNRDTVKMIHHPVLCLFVLLFFSPLPSSAIMSTVLPASINPETLTKWRSIQISSSRQQSMAIRSRTLIGILYSACSLVVLMALNLTVYPFNKGATSCLELSERLSGESESLRKWGRPKKRKEKKKKVRMEWCSFSRAISFFFPIWVFSRQNSGYDTFFIRLGALGRFLEKKENRNAIRNVNIWFHNPMLW